MAKKKSASLPGETNIPTQPFPAPGWRPRYFIVAHIRILLVNGKPTPNGYDPNKSACYRITDLDVSLRKIEPFAMAVRDGTPLGTHAYPLHVLKNNPDGFRIKAPCHIVFALDPEWQFRRGQPGMTMGQSSNNYADLWEVPEQGVPLKAPAPIGSHCRVVYFSAKTIPHTKTTDPFLLYAESLTSHFLPVPIDPDVKNDGTSPQWP